MTALKVTVGHFEAKSEYSCHQLFVTPRVVHLEVRSLQDRRVGLNKFNVENYSRNVMLYVVKIIIKSDFVWL